MELLKGHALIPKNINGESFGQTMIMTETIIRVFLRRELINKLCRSVGFQGEKTSREEKEEKRKSRRVIPFMFL